MVNTFSLFSQEGRNVTDTLRLKNDSTLTDTSKVHLRKASKTAIDTKVTYRCNTKIRRDLVNKTVTLVQGAVVNYGELEIKADSIVFNMETNLLFAIGIKDTTGKINGKPVFKEGTQEIQADELTYNFKTKRARAKNIVTKQDQGLLHSQFTKLLEDGTSNIAKSTYSTCDADTPHFYINLPKARVYPGKKIISGPGNLVLEGIPLPLVIPFGYFPIQTKKAASGILIPRIGEEQTRGYSLTEGGYYFALSNYYDLLFKGNLYANGTWMLTAQTNYNRLYRYNGNFAFSYAINISGHKGLSDYFKYSNYRLGWTYNQDAKASPGSRFSASVNMSSSGYDKNNSYVVTDHVTTQRASSISYSKSWDGTPFNFAMSLNHSQNVKNRTVSLNLPKMNFNIQRINPFKSRRSSGPSKWYQDIQLSYSAQLDNRINNAGDSILFTKEILKHMQNGFKHDIPLSFQLRPFKNFSISPSLTYSGVMYTQKVTKRWDPKHLDPATNEIVPVVIDTLRGIFYGQAVNPSISASFNPQVFGTYDFSGNPNSRLFAIRHVIKPSIGFSFTPDVEGLTSKNMYRQVQVDTLKHTSPYSIYEGSIFGTPSLGQKSGNISLSLVNLVEAKIFARNDTTGKPKKVKIIDNFGITTSYNIFADSLRWAPLNMNIRTTLFNNINISSNANFSLYGVKSNGQPLGVYAYKQNGKLMRLTNFMTSLDFSLSELLKKNKDKDKNKANNTKGALNQGNTGFGEIPGQTVPGQPATGEATVDEYGYPAFDVPWSLNVTYNFSYSKFGLKPVISQTLSMSGNVSITKKMSLTYTSGYDFTGKQITQSNIGMSRDLHCWTMNLSWVPNGIIKMWSFTIKVKASVLGDLKYERRKDFHDSY
jgi:hypothetical protein